MVKVHDTVTIINDIDGYVSGLVMADLGNNKYSVRRADGSVGIYNVRDLSGGKRRTNKRKSRKSRKSRKYRN